MPVSRTRFVTGEIASVPSVHLLAVLKTILFLSREGGGFMVILGLRE